VKRPPPPLVKRKARQSISGVRLPILRRWFHCADRRRANVLRLVKYGQVFHNQRVTQEFCVSGASSDPDFVLFSSIFLSSVIRSSPTRTVASVLSARILTNRSVPPAITGHGWPSEETIVRQCSGILYLSHRLFPSRRAAASTASHFLVSRARQRFPASAARYLPVTVADCVSKALPPR